MVGISAVKCGMPFEGGRRAGIQIRAGLGLKQFTGTVPSEFGSLKRQGGILFGKPPPGDSGSAGTRNGGGASSEGSGVGMGGGTGHEYRLPRGVPKSKPISFSKTGWKSYTHSTTILSHSGNYTADSSYNIADHMSGLSISADKPCASAPKQAGHSKGKSTSKEIVEGVEAIGTEYFDEDGNPVYWGTICENGKAVKRASVDIYGLVSGQSQYFCFDADG